MNRFGVLGPVEVVRDGAPVPLKGPRPRAVLARLIVARGRVVPVDTLVADLWPADPPEGAVAAIRTFVADLRRALEPDRPPRQPARLLVTAGPGYALRAAADAVDAWRFEAAVAATPPPAESLAALDRALASWRGPAYAEFADQPWARADIDRLDELRRSAVSRRAEALLALGRPLEAVADLRAQAAAHPLREDAWRLLALALYRAGRQGEALAALRSAREVLVEELGVDPGPELRRLEGDILAQAPHLDPLPPFTGPPSAPDPPGIAAPAAVDQPALPVATNAPGTASPAATNPRGTGPLSPVSSSTGTRGHSPSRPFFGREEELAVLVGAAEDVTRHGRPRLALVSGDAGSGKTALAEALTRRLAAAGWITAWGRSPEFEGAPTAWPWRQIAESLPDPRPILGLTDADEPAAARFRLRQAAVTQLTAVAARAPVLLVVDDLHRTDDGTLDLLAALTTGDLTAPVLVAGTYRATEIGPDLTAALARYARAEPVRVYLGALPGSATAALVRDITAADDDAVAEVHRRSGGNPFFARELARLLATDGAAALAQVPAGVRDVIRHRLAQLPEPAQTVLRQAAVAGRDLDPDVLAALAGPDAALDGVEHGLRAGFLTEEEDGRVRFTHILVRDTLYRDLSAPRRARWHAAAGAAVEELHPSDVATLAYHFASAADRATAPRAGRYARAAAARAEARADLHEAARLWRLAVDADERAGTDVADRLPAVMGLGRALALTGHLGETRRLRAEAVRTAEKLDDPAGTARVITAFDVPAIWPRNDDEALSRQVAEAADRTLAALTGPAELRSRLLSALALELRGTTTDRGRRAAEDAEAIARRTGDPGALAFALNARFLHTFHRTGLAGERARIGTELVELAGAHGLVTFEVLGRLILLQSHSARGDVAAADREAAALDTLAARYDLPVVGVFTQWYAALRAALTAAGSRLGPRLTGAPAGVGTLARPGLPPGALAEVESLYRAADDHLSRRDMPGMAGGLLPLALLSVRGTPDGLADWGPYEPWVRPLILLGAGDRGAVRAALRDLPESPHDLLREARLCLAARAALAVGDRATMARLHADLLPAAGELAGAASGALSFGPVASYVDALAAAVPNAPPARRAEPDVSRP